MKTLPNSRGVIAFVHVFNFACTSLALLVVFAWARPKFGWGPAALVCAAVLSTPIFLVQTEQVGLEIAVTTATLAAMVSLVSGRPLLAGLIGLVAFFVKWTAIVYFPAAIVWLVIAFLRRNWLAGGKSPVGGLVVHLVGLAVAGAVLILGAVPGRYWGGWVAEPVFGTSPLIDVWQWSPELLVLAVFNLLILVVVVTIYAGEGEEEGEESEGQGTARSSEGQQRSEATSSAMILDTPMLWLCITLVAGTVTGLGFVGATPSSFVIVVPAVAMITAIVVMSAPRWRFAGMILFFAWIAFNLLNVEGQFLPNMSRGLDWRTGAIRERSREYFEDHQSNISAVNALVEKANGRAIVAPPPLVQFLSYPALGYVKKPLSGYTLGTVANDHFASMQQMMDDDPRDLVVARLMNRFLFGAPWVAPMPEAAETILYDDRKLDRNEKAPLVVFSLRKIPSDTPEAAKERYLRRFWTGRRLMEEVRQKLAQSDYNGAELILRRLLRADPRNQEARYLLGSVLESRGDTKGAIEQYSEVAVGSSTYWQAASQLASIYSTRKEFQMADHLNQEAVEAFQKSFQDPRALATLYLRWAANDAAQEKLDGAAEKLEKAVEVDPSFAVGYRELAMIELDRGNPDNALQHMFKALGLGRDDPDTQRYLGLVHSALKNWDKARNAFAEARNLNPDDIQARDGLATALLQLGENEQAAIEFEAALARRPSEEWRTTLNIGLGQVHRKLKDWKGALFDLREATRLDPNSVAAANELAWLLATCPDDSIRNGEEAVKISEGVNNALEEPNAAILDTLGAAYAEVGDFGKATDAARRAIELAEKEGDQGFVKEFGDRLDLYKAGKPYREATNSQTKSESEQILE